MGPLSVSKTLGGMEREIVLPGAFAESIKRFQMVNREMTPQRVHAGVAHELLIFDNALIAYQGRFLTD